jgi:hypothetical protein
VRVPSLPMQLVYLCCMWRNVKLMRGWVMLGSLGTSCLKFFCVSPAMISKLPWGSRSENAMEPSFRRSRKSRSAFRLTDAITGFISGSLSACSPTLPFPSR